VRLFMTFLGYAFVATGLLVLFYGSRDGFFPNAHADELRNPCPKDQVIDRKQVCDNYAVCVASPPPWRRCSAGNPNGVCGCLDCKGITILSTEPAVWGSFGTCRPWSYWSDELYHVCYECKNKRWRCGKAYCFDVPLIKGGHCPAANSVCVCTWTAPPDRCWRHVEP
jgi:hypothetical protein